MVIRPSSPNFSPAKSLEIIEPVIDAAMQHDPNVSWDFSMLPHNDEVDGHTYLGVFERHRLHLLSVVQRLGAAVSEGAVAYSVRDMRSVHRYAWRQGDKEVQCFDMRDRSEVLVESERLARVAMLTQRAGIIKSDIPTYVASRWSGGPEPLSMQVGQGIMHTPRHPVYGLANTYMWLATQETEDIEDIHSALLLA